MTNFMKDKFVHITRMFDDRLKSFIKIMLMNGKTEYYCYRIEFQLRGLPHAHGVIWLKNEVIQKYIQHTDNGIEYTDDITKLIDQWVSVSLDTGSDELNSLVKEVNSHKHTKSCMKRGTGHCRFNFPRFPSKETIIAKPLVKKSDASEDDIKENEEELKKAKRILSTVRAALETIDEETLQKNSLEDFLKSLKIGFDEYHDALSKSERGKSVILKRELNEINVNNYNPSFLLSWKANMDIQFCMDHYGVVTYVTDYFSKDDTGLTQVLQKALKESKHTNDFDRLNYLKKVFFTHRQICVSEAAYRLISGLSLKGSNVKCLFVQSGFPENRTTFLRRITEDDDERDGEDDEEPGNEDDPVQPTPHSNIVTMSNREGQYCLTQTIHEKYEKRPLILKEMCLAQFATHYQICPKLPKKIQMDDNNASLEKSNQTIFRTNEKLPLFIILNDQKGNCMKLRNSPFVLRLHKKKLSHEQIYSETLLFLPYMNETVELFTEAEKCIKLYEEKKNIINENRKRIYPFSKDIDLVETIIESDENRPVDAYDMLDATKQQEDSDDAENLEPIDDSELPEEPSNIDKPHDGSKFKPIIPDEISQMKDNVRKLSFEQRIVFDNVISYCKDVVMAKKSTNFHPDPPKFIVHGMYFLARASLALLGIVIQ